MANVVDLLISEVASFLKITPDEVRAKFTKEQLDELLANSLCEPIDESGIPITSLDGLPCDDLAIPDLLPDQEITDLPEPTPDTKATKCIDDVKKINEIITEQLDQYTKHSMLYEKMVEYRDNYYPIQFYYEELAKEAAKMFNLFEPIVEIIQTGEAQLAELQNAIDNLSDLMAAAGVTLNFPLVQVLSVKRELVKKEYDEVDDRLQKAKDDLENAKAGYDVYNSVAYDVFSGTTGTTEDIRILLRSTLSSTTLSDLNNKLQDYSEGIEVSKNPISSSNLVGKSLLSFKLEFLELDTFVLVKEDIDQENGERYETVTPFPIRNNPLLEKQTFFQPSPGFSVSQLNLNDRFPTGVIYEDFYNLLADPTNNFFTLAERGLTDNGDLVDPSLKGTDGEIKKEGETDYYISDLKTMQDFYENFEVNFAVKKAQRREQYIKPSITEIRAIVKQIARLEISNVLAINNIDVKTRSNSNELRDLSSYYAQVHTDFAKGAHDLQTEITRLDKKVQELKPSKDKTKKLLRESSPECFDQIDQDTSPCSSVMSKLGKDPMGTKTLNGTDPTLPNQNKMCYWAQFALIVNLMGLIPMPNLPDVTALRYWPVGLTIPSPGGLIKIPLPIIWIPLVAIPSPLGTVVIFLTINGLFISPIVFFVSSTGNKQHIVTAKGSGDSIGYNSDDESIKPDIQSSVLALSIKGKADRLAKEAQLGKNFNLSDSEKLQLKQSKERLNEVEKKATASGNENRLMKVKREKKNLERASTVKSQYEKMASILDKGDSASDLIDQVRHAIFNQFDKIGKPVLSKSNKIKDRIAKRDNEKFKAKQKALVDNKPEEAHRITSEMQTDGINLSSKTAAISDDMFAYFDRIQLPKVTIPKDASTIDPKPNAIQELASTLLDFGDTFKTQFKSKEDSQLNNILSKQLAKSKQTISDELDKINPNGDKYDIDKDFDKIQKAMSKITSVIIDNASGQNIKTSYSAQTTKIEDINKRIESESDPSKKKALEKTAIKEKSKLSEIYEQEQTRDAMKLAPSVMAAFSGAAVDFNAFSSCCNSQSFSLPDIPSPALPIFASVKGILDTAISGIGKTEMKTMFGGKTKVSTNELKSGYLGILKKNVPKDIVMPLPDLNLASFAGTFAGLFGSLFEPKAPILAAQPAMPASITIDLNILKAPLRALLKGYLDNSLPSNNQSGTTPSKSSDASGYTGKNSDAILDKDITILDFCDPDPNDSSLSGGKLDGKSPEEKSKSAGAFNNNKVIVDTQKDILPAFQNLDIDFMNVNPGDLLAILKNFIDMGLDKVEALLDPFYSLLSVVKSPKNTNLNVIEFAQQKIPPPGPGMEGLFTGITQLKKAIPKSATMMIVDEDTVKTKSAVIETVLAPIVNSPLPQIMVVGAGAVDSIIPTLKIPSVDSSGSVKTQDLKATSFALRQLNPVVSQDDLPPWERLSPSNLLFLLFLDQFIGSAADKVGLFRNYL